MKVDLSKLKKIEFVLKDGTKHVFESPNFGARLITVGKQGGELIIKENKEAG
jgi:hypothetical protein